MPAEGFYCNLEAGIRHFNRHEFYEAHEVWEDQWHLEVDESSRKFLQSLIQIAAGFYKIHVEQNPRGLHKSLVKAMRNLQPFLPANERVDTTAIQTFMEEWNGRALKMIETGELHFEPREFPEIEKS